MKNQSRRGVVIVTNKMEQAEERKEVDGPWTNGIQKPKQLHRYSSNTRVSLLSLQIYE